jgi:hypothetical protein
MSSTGADARREVNSAIVNTGSKGVGQIVDTGNSSIEKRRKNKEEREKREAEEKAAKEKVDAVPSLPLSISHFKKADPGGCYMLTVINHRRARHGTPAEHVYIHVVSSAISPKALFPISCYCLYGFGIFTCRSGESCLRAREL